jgi:hypothetical protein
MPKVVKPKRKAAPKMPIGRMHPDPSTRYQMRIFGPGGERFDRSYTTPEMMKRWWEHYRKKGFRTRAI